MYEEHLKHSYEEGGGALGAEDTGGIITELISGGGGGGGGITSLGEVVCRGLGMVRDWPKVAGRVDGLNTGLRPLGAGGRDACLASRLSSSCCK